MGEVFEAYFEPAHRRFALKILGIDAHDDPEARTRFAYEYWALDHLHHKLRHESIVVPFCAGEDEGLRWYAMELLEGESLDHVIDRRVLAPLSVCRIGVQIADACAAMHAIGLIHRDLKPGNIFLLGGEGDRVKLLDTGIVKLLPEFFADAEMRPQVEERLQTLAGAPIGTPGFMAPEVLLGAKAAPAQDIFGLAATLFRLAVGRHAYAALLAPGPGHEPRWSEELGRPLPRALEVVLRKALTVDPSRRQSSMSELREQLDLVLEELELEAAEAEGETTTAVIEIAALGEAKEGGVGESGAGDGTAGPDAIDGGPAPLEGWPAPSPSDYGGEVGDDERAEAAAEAEHAGVEAVELPRPTSDPDTEGRTHGPERGDADPLASSAESYAPRSHSIDDRPRWIRLAALVVGAILCVAAGDLLGRTRTQGSGVEAPIRWARGVDQAARRITPTGATAVAPTIAAPPRSPSDSDATSPATAPDHDAAPTPPPDTSTAPANPTTEAPAPPPRRTLAATAFRKTLSPHRAALERCTRGIPEAPELAAEVRVSAGGSVEGVRLTPSVSFIAEQCVADILGGLRFPQAEGPSTHTWRLQRP